MHYLRPSDLPPEIRVSKKLLRLPTPRQFHKRDLNPRRRAYFIAGMQSVSLVISAISSTETISH